MRDFRKLHVWQQAHTLVLNIYEHTKSMPKYELYGLTNQLRRASASISTNIAEGCGKDSESDFARFLQISFASACETEYLLILCQDLNYFDKPTITLIQKEVELTKKMLATFIRRIRPNK